jgi:hypothetical protein
MPTRTAPEDFEDEPEDEEGGGFDELCAADQALLRAAERSSDFEVAPKKGLPQPEKGKSMPDLPKVKLSSFRRLLK